MLGHYSVGFITSGCFLLCGVSLWCGFKEKHQRAGLFKIMASLCFVLLAWQMALIESYPWLFAGLTLCLIGDALLTASGKGKAFALGMISFLMAHLCYSLSFIKLGTDIRLTLIVLSVLICLAILTVNWMIIDLSGHLKAMVTSYVCMISIMVALSWGVMGTHKDAWWISMGATLFAFSDIFVAINRFKRPAFINRLIGLPLYYSAQLLIILGFYKIL